MTPSPKLELTTTDQLNVDKSESSLKKGDKTKIDESFSWFEKPHGQEQYVHNVLVLGSAHIAALYYCYIFHITKEVNPMAFAFELFYCTLGGLGTTLGCHRYWTHKTFKANMPLQIILMLMQTISHQYPIYKWCLDHRIHHKYTDTDADPHNSKRGFWFSHIGWLFLPKTKELKEKLKTFDMPDLEKDPIVRFQSRWYYTLVPIFHFLIPITVYYYVFDMPLFYCYLANCRSYVMTLHFTFSVNSFAHLWGDKPYDKTISSVDNKIVSFFSVGEGWHNYHHTFPWDYRASEFGWKINVSTALIDFFAWMGWAWDLKTVPEIMIHEKVKKTGDGSRVASKGSHNSQSSKELCQIESKLDDSKAVSYAWGWDDDCITDEMRKITRIINPK